MKRALLLIFTSMPLPVLAEATKAEICEVVGDMAESVMTQRQDGSKMSDMLRIYGEELAEVPAAVDHITRLTLLAFEQPLFSSDDGKRTAVVEFRNQAELDCFKS
jgi:hypothetical protein